ncbi:MAG: hypothetical protein JNL57_13035 [Bacteroidetes bacterium]|nr:hypothetical protein [Bacteroidota bacterium]
MKIIRFKFLFAILFAVWAPIASAQPYLNPRKVASGITLNLEINEQKDLDFIRKNLKRFYGVQHVRVNGNVDISKVAGTLSLLDEVEDVQLLKFTGELTDDDLEKLEWVSNITLFLRNGKEDQILLNNYLGKLPGLTLIFEVVPEDYQFMAGWTKVRELTLVAPYVAKEIPAAISAAAVLPGLQSFGISTDKLTDLPPSVKSIQGLKKLVIIDNLSWMSEKYLEDLSVLHKNLEYQYQNGYRYLDFTYKATDAELTQWEHEHLLSLFPASRFAPLMSAGGDSGITASFADFVKIFPPKEPAFSQVAGQKSLLPEFKDGEYRFAGNNEQDRIYYLGTDAAVLIPKGCMEVAGDSLWNGSYSLRIQWLNQPREMFSRGYSLQFDSSGIAYDLAPQGLFELSAAAGNMPLQIKDGYFVKFVFLSQADTVSRFYAYSKNKGRWMHFYDYDYNFDDSKIKPIDFHGFYSNKHTATEVLSADQTHAAQRFETEGYFYSLPPGVNRQSLESWKGFYVSPVADRAPKAGAYTLRRGRNLIGIKREYADKRSEKGIIRFQIFDKTANLFPELKALENYALEIRTAMNSRDFTAHFIRGAVYSDVRIVQEGAHWFLDLRTETGYWRLQLLQPYEKYKKKSRKGRAQQQEFLRRMKQYFAIVEEKNAAAEGWEREFLESTSANNKRVLFYGQIKPRGTAVREFRVRSTGLFAWAVPVLQPDSFNLTLKMTDAGGIPLDVKRAWIAHSSPFSYQTFGAADVYFGRIQPAKLQYIACVDSKNRVYVMNASTFKTAGASGNSFIYLPLTEIPHAVKSAQELDTLLGIKNK